MGYPSLRIAASLSLLLCVTLTACGARSELRQPAPDALMVEDAAAQPDVQVVDDVPLVAPDCGTAVPIGSIRARAMGIGARVAIGPDRNLYTAQRTREQWTAISLDECLRERWRTLLPGLERSTRLRVMVDARGDVWFAGRGGTSFARLTSAGVPRPLEAMWEGRLDTFVGVRSEGPIFSAFITSEEKYLVVVDGNSVRRVRLETPSSFVYPHECLLVGGTTACWNVSYSAVPQRLWLHPDAEIIDGTFRHVTPPAFDGTRLWTVRYGISTYELISLDVRTGQRSRMVPLMRTTRGQSELLLGPAVITRESDVVIYVHGSGHDGRLRAFRSDASEHWSFPAPWFRRSTQSGGAIFSDEATHLVGRGGVIYLAVGETAYAIDAMTGMQVWSLPGLGDVNESAVNLSPNGDLYVLDVTGTLTAIATGSAGLDATTWPIPGGNAGLSLAW